MFVLSGCSEKEALSQEKPKVIHNDFLFYKHELLSGEDASIGSLYIRSDKNEPEKISSNVMYGTVQYINDKEKVLFINDEGELYEYTKGKEKSKLAEDVADFEVKNKGEIITFTSDDGDLYIFRGESEKEKITSNVAQYEIIGEYVVYIDDDGDLSMYHLTDKQEKEIATDSSHFVNLDGQDEIAYLNEDQALYYYKAGEENPIKITGNEVGFKLIKKIGNNLIYLNVEDDDSHELFSSEIKEGSSPIKIASDIRNYKFSNGYYYYLNFDGNLYKKKAGDKDSKKLASDVANFQIKKGILYYADEDSALYKLDDKKGSLKVNSSVEYYELTEDGEIVYETKDKDLYIGEKKIASDLDGFELFFENIAYVSEKKLYVIEKMGDKKLIADDLDRYSNVFYQRGTIFTNTLELDDIAGIWSLDGEEGSYFLEIGKDGKLKYLLNGHEAKLNVDYATYDSIYATVGDEYQSYSLQGDELIIRNNGNEYFFQPSTKEAADAYAKQLQEQQAREEISSLMAKYLSGFEDAVSYGDPDYITDYIDTKSKLYQQQSDFVVGLYEKDIREYLNEYSIVEVKGIGPDAYNVKVYESWRIYQNYDASEKEFENTYTIKKINGKFLLMDLKVQEMKSGGI